MNNAVKQFSHLGVYRGLTTPALLNIMLCNRVMQNKWLVANSPKLYTVSKSILGGTIVDTVIQKTFCKALTAGNTLQQAQKVS